MKQLSLIIPAYNEEKRIKKTILNCERVLQGSFKNYEIIAVLNGCKDDTLKVIKELQEKIPRLKFLNYAEAIGKGGAIIEVMKYSEGGIIGFIDADEAFSMDCILRLIENIHGGADCVIASKWKNQRFREVNEPTTKKILSRGWNQLVRTILDLNYYDTQAGAKFFKREVMEGIGYDFISRDFTFDTELLFKIKQKKYRVKEVFIPNKDVEGSTFKLRHSVPMFIKLMKIWWSK